MCLFAQVEEPRGVTYVWNLAYQHFKAQPQYEAMFFVNNDIIFANNAFEEMAKVHYSKGLSATCASSLVVVIANTAHVSACQLPWGDR